MRELSMTLKAKYRREWKKNRKREGICCDCSLPSKPGKIRCEKHAKADAEQQLNKGRLRKLKGLCLRCGKLSVFGHIRCKKHLIEHTRRNIADKEKYLSEGRCYRCGREKGPLDTTKCCGLCIEKVRRAKENHI